MVDNCSLQSWWIFGKHLYANETASPYSLNSPPIIKENKPMGEQQFIRILMHWKLMFTVAANENNKS